MSRVMVESVEERDSVYRAASTPIHSTTSSIVMMLPARLDMRTSSPSRSILTNWPISTSMLCVGVVARARRDGLEPADVAVVVGAEHVDR